MSTPPKMSARACAAGLAAILLLGSVGPRVEAQDRSPIVVPEAEPYEPDEFPRWARDLRRAEIVALGSLPIALLASRLLYGLARFTVESLRAGAVAPAFLPPGIAPPGAVPYTRTDNVRIILGAISISGIVAAIDFGLGRAEERAIAPSEPAER